MKNSILACALLIGIYANAQKDSLTARNTIFIEGLGNGIVGSINYDRLFFIKKTIFSIRFGFFYIPMKKKELNSEPLTIPIEFNILRGKKNNYFEVGFGLSYAYAFNSSDRVISDGVNFTSVQEFSEALYLSFKPVGYRFQKERGGLFFRVSGLILYKALEINKNYMKRPNEFILGPYFGVAIGYTFKYKLQ